MPNLPPEDAITAYSRKFYDGTYTWDTSGFTDESGVYREFDCMDPEAGAPTPLPPMFDDDDDEEEEGSRAHISDEPKGGEKIAAANDGPVWVPRDELFVGRPDRDGLVAKLEGIVLAYKHLDKDLSLEDCYKLCETELPTDMSHKGKESPGSTKKDESDGNEPDQVMLDILEKPSIAITMEMPRKEESGSSPDLKKKDDRRVSSDSSGLSDVPSDLSAQSPSNKNTSTPPSEPAKNQEQEKYDQEDELKDDGKPPRKKATRGVAQKVRKSTRKATAAKAKPAKKTGPSTSLAALHSGTYRRSARQEAKLGTNR